MATQDEEHQRHRELMAATLFSFVCNPGTPWSQAILEAFQLADQLLAYSRSPP